MVWQQENRLTYEDFLDKYRVVLWIFVFLFSALSARLFFLQIIRGSYYKYLSEQQRTQVILERAPRGLIYDRNGSVIVGNKTAFIALFYPFSQNIVPTKQMLGHLREILPIKNLNVLITQGWRTGQVVRLSDNLTRKEMFKLQEQRLVLPGISVVKEARRDYKSPEANSHLAGYLSEITPRELENLRQDGYSMGDWIGRGGLEQIFDYYLRGEDGGWQIEVDAQGRQTRLVRRIPPKEGSDIHTTIDVRLQDAAYKALKASTSGKGAVIVSDVKTGALKAIVSSPGYDPNISFSKDFSKYLVDPELPLFNRAIQA
ncbi:MAG: hypothetical protein JW803_07530, partial [Endomicrobiales bacterium]|nr:hypothetical protein [Endomicrobiales bacterium]